VFRRRLVPFLVFLLIAGAAWGVARLSPRSPAVILLVCVLAVLAMKLVERRILRWRRQWEAREMERQRRGPQGR
jgi:peptidoglycan/LPS O-acetylase OafA/YrhL